MHFLFLLALYFLPAIVAHARHSTSATGITVVNLLLGWTGIGWFATLLWAFFSATWQDYGYYGHLPYQSGVYGPGVYGAGPYGNGAYGQSQAPYYPARYPHRW